MAKKVIIIIAVAILLAFGYIINLGLTLARVSLSPSGEIYRLIFMVVYALIYLLCWLYLLRLGRKRNAAGIWKLYLIFWIASTVFFTLSPLIPLRATALLQSIHIFGWFIFAIPLVGFDAIILHISASYFHTATLYAALTISLIMFILGLLAKRKFRA